MEDIEKIVYTSVAAPILKEIIAGKIQKALTVIGKALKSVEIPVKLTTLNRSKLTT
ncbi:MAG: hypothetical protein Q8S11_02860 [Daejeonella sp.]|nr:hypothetical protein [Daejeonella sp.]